MAGATFATSYDPPGVKVVTVVPTGPFARAGIEVGDVVVAVNGRPITNVTDANKVIGAAPRGVPVPVELFTPAKKSSVTTVSVTF